MKVYVNKDKDGKYIAENYERLYDLRYAEMFNDYEIALCYCPTDCQVVEVQLMETTELTDYTKQVRKEVCEEMWKEFEQRLMNKTQDMPIMKVANMINSVLDQIQGE